MQNNLTLGSLFDGSGGFPLAGLMTGIAPVWASEIEPFCIRVTTRRFPNMKHYGDISKMNGAEVEPVDIITFGSPCQNLSLAGNRSGLAGEKSSMFFEAIRIIKEMRCATNGKYPRWIVWENVPGALSSAKGQDFRTVLEEICRIKDETVSVPMPEKKWYTAGEVLGNGYSVAYRILNAQFFGVPQRRRRIFLVADFGGETAGKILFESEGLFRNFTKSRNSWQRTAADAQAGINKPISFEPGIMSRVGGHYSNDCTNTLRSRMGDNQMCVAIENHPNDCRVNIDESGTVQTLTGRAGTGGGNTPMVMSERLPGLPLSENVGQCLLGSDYKGVQCVFENHSQDTRYTGPLEVAQTVSATYGMGGNNQPFVVNETAPKTLKVRCGCDGGGKGALIQDNQSATLSCNNDQTVFVPKAYGICSNDSNSMKSDNPNSGIYEADTSRTIDGNGGNPSCNQGGMVIVESYAIQGSMIGRKDENGPQGDGINKDVSFTLNTADRHAVYAIDRAAYNQGKNAQFDISITDDGTAQTVVAKGPGAVASFYPQMKAECQSYREEVANTLVNGTNPGYQNGIVEPSYTVRRLTPLECCRLQGFPDYWCEGLETEEPTKEQIQYWYDVFETYKTALGKKIKAKTESQIIKWLKNPYSDSSIYAMWGNGVALPCVVYVMLGIVNCE